MDVEERLQRIETELELLLPLRRLAAPAAPDMIAEWARISMMLLRMSAVAGTLCAVAGVPGDLARREWAAILLWCRACRCDTARHVASRRAYASGPSA
jgi:hypothetical protein